MAEHTTSGKMPMDASAGEKDVKEYSASPTPEHDVEVGKSEQAALTKGLQGRHMYVPSPPLSPQALTLETGR
jgi:hypothetical protein